MVCPVAQLAWTKLQQILNTSTPLFADIDATPVVLNQDMLIFHVVGTFNSNCYDQHDH